MLQGAGSELLWRAAGCRFRAAVNATSCTLYTQPGHFKQLEGRGQPCGLSSGCLDNASSRCTSRVRVLVCCRGVLCMCCVHSMELSVALDVQGNLHHCLYIRLQQRGDLVYTSIGMISLTLMQHQKVTPCLPLLCWLQRGKGRAASCQSLFASSQLLLGSASQSGAVCCSRLMPRSPQRSVTNS